MIDKGGEMSDVPGTCHRTDPDAIMKLNGHFMHLYY